MKAIDFYGEKFWEEMRRQSVKPLEERKEAAREYLDERVDALLNDLIITVEREEAAILLGMDRKWAVEFIDKIWKKNYGK